MKTTEIKLCIMAIRKAEFPEVVDSGAIQEAAQRISSLVASRAAVAAGGFHEVSFLKAALEWVDRESQTHQD